MNCMPRLNTALEASLGWTPTFIDLRTYLSFITFLLVAIWTVHSHHSLASLPRAGKNRFLLKSVMGRSLFEVIRYIQHSWERGILPFFAAVLCGKLLFALLYTANSPGIFPRFTYDFGNWGSC